MPHRKRCQSVTLPCNSYPLAKYMYISPYNRTSPFNVSPKSTFPYSFCLYKLIETIFFLHITQNSTIFIQCIKKTFPTFIFIPCPYLQCVLPKRFFSTMILDVSSAANNLICKFSQFFGQMSLFKTNYSLKQNPSRDLRAGEGLLLWDPKNAYHIHKSSLLVPGMGQINPSPSVCFRTLAHSLCFLGRTARKEIERVDF